MAIQMKKTLNKNTMDLENNEEQTVLNKSNYPELEGVEVGSPISGTWSGTVTSVNDDQVVVKYESMEIETENQADKEMKQMTKQPMNRMAEPEEE